MSTRRFNLLAILRRFWGAREGNVAIMFGLALIPVMVSVGAAIDYSRANSVKADLQAALDAAGLMLAREAATDTPTQLQQNALAYVNANFNRPGVSVSKVVVNYSSTAGSKLSLSGTVTVPTDFMGIIGKDSIDVGTSSTTAWGSTRLRVALVLDNTGSMSQHGKLTALIAATKNLLAQLQSAAFKDGDVYVSIIPFVKDVNVGASNYNANWIYWGTKTQDPTLSDNTSWDANNGTCSRGRSFSDRGSCVAYPACSNTRFTIKSQCQMWGGTWYTTAGTWTPKTHNSTNWNGCVMDRGTPNGPDTTYNYDTNVASSDSSKPNSLYVAEQYSLCPSAAIMPLSYDWSGMTSLISSMTANGSTNQNIGLQLGWMSLVGGGPFPTPPAEDPGYTYQHIIILLTDGLNTQDRWYGDGYNVGTSDDAKIDARQQMTCDNFKSASTSNILYTIQVNTDGDPTSTLLQNCASTPDKFTLLTSADQIAATFQRIGDDLTKLRVAQ